MARGLLKRPRQAEKLLMILLDGHVTTQAEIVQTLGGEIALYRLSVYLWNLKQCGAEIVRTKQGNKVVAIQLLNPHVMRIYAQKRGFLPPDPVVLDAKDFALVAG